MVRSSGALAAMRSAQDWGDLPNIADTLRALAAQQEAAGHHRYAAVSRLNLASILVWMGAPEEAVGQATRAAVTLGATTPGVEHVSALVARATALIQLGLNGEAEQVMLTAAASPSPIGRQEAALEERTSDCLAGRLWWPRVCFLPSRRKTR